MRLDLGPDELVYTDGLYEEMQRLERALREYQLGDIGHGDLAAKLRLFATSVSDLADEVQLAADVFE